MTDQNKKDKILKGITEGSIAFAGLVFLALIVNVFVLPKEKQITLKEHIPLEQSQKPRATLTINPKELEINKGKTFELTIPLNTHNAQVSAASAIINYNSNMLKLLEVKDGTGFDNYLVDDSELGTIYLEAIATPGNSVQNSAELAKITFETLQAGNTSVSIKHSKNNEEIGSSIINAQSGGNILKEVQNGTYKITKK